MTPVSSSRALAPTSPRHREFAILMAWIGDGLITRGDTTAALAAYESALAADGSNLDRPQ